MASSELVCFVLLMSYMLRRWMFVKRIRSEISPEMTPSQQAPILQFRAIILRITLYPLLSCVLGFSGTTVDLYLAKHLENTELKVQLTVLDQCIFNARPFLYAVLAATDPSFLRAIDALRNLHPSAGSQQTSNTLKCQSLSSRSTTSSSDMRTLADGNNAEGDSMVRQSLDAAARPQTKTEAVVNHTCTHRDPEEGIERHSNVVESRRDSIEFQI
ncbi:hypothetical protein B0H14DRAFT_3453275 [Mycena olivaceomarginata]|nr:hypothetical protein B0H14DRAFT_3453275 [Mycena olivaceomarginata]